MTKTTMSGRTQSEPEMQYIRPKGTLRLSLDKPKAIMPDMDYTSIEKRLLAINGYTQNEETGAWHHDPSFKPATRVREGFKHQEMKGSDGVRAITFERAKAQYPHRFTMDHVPKWAGDVCKRSGKYPGPHYGSDLEWYNNTEFPDRGGRKLYCRSLNQSYPAGKWLDTPYVQQAKPVEDPRKVKKAERVKGRREKAAVPAKVVDMIMAAAKSQEEAAAKAKQIKEAEAKARAAAALAQPKVTKIVRPGKKARKAKPKVVTVKSPAKGTKSRTQKGRK